jgi:hypothetical protein
MALAFAASFLFVLLKALQQLNVVHHKVWWVMPTSFGMATTEVFVIANVANMGWGWIVIPIGLGGGMGCIVAMHLHQFLRNNRYKEPK